MSDGPALSDDQWNAIRQIVHDEALRARVAASFLPLYGPLPAGATTVPKERLIEPASGEKNGVLKVDDDDTLRLASVSVNVTLKNHMLADPELGAASILFRRAANIVARVEDALVFRGRSQNTIAGVDKLPPVFHVSGSETYNGLVGFDASGNAHNVPIAPEAGAVPLGANVYAAVVEAINELEAAAYFKPYACILSNSLFSAVYKPIPGSMVLPADGLPPVLSGPLLRSSTLDKDTGLVVSLQGNAVEIVVGSDIHVRYLQANEHGDHLFRVSQRLVLRIKDRTSLAFLAVASGGGSGAGGKTA